MNLLNEKLIRKKIEIVQVNVGNLCNQECEHCHVEGSPQGENNMDRESAEKIIKKIIDMGVTEVDFTGGAPEMNENLPFMLEKLYANNIKITVRTNLTVLDTKKYEYFLDLFKKYEVKLVASLPCYLEGNVDKQRGNGVFNSSIRMLKKLNDIGYGTGTYALNLVYNPRNESLPAPQKDLEFDYKNTLKGRYDVEFDNLITIVNSPIGNYKKKLMEEGKYNSYMALLKDNYNGDIVKNVMCKRLISVDYNGEVYDCDFNRALKFKAIEEGKKFWDIDFSKEQDIALAEHCYACTAGSGSSCYGALDEEFNTEKVVKEYYGSTLQSSKDLKTNACCTLEEIPKYIKRIIPMIDEEIILKFYGCGSPIPLALEGLKVLDLGSGTGRDCYILSKLVGENGFVNGIDMTENQIKVAKKHVDTFTQKLGYKKPNINFIHDYIEKAKDHIEANSLDLVTSNCVINLVEDKEEVLRQVYSLLKNGGEMYFSDVYLDRRLNEEARKDNILYGECIGGALYYKDFERIARKVGFIDPRVVSTVEIEIYNDELKDLLGNTKIYSSTYRLWKIDGLEDDCEDYGHVAIYRGGIEDSQFKFKLDDGHIFEKNKAERVCGNTAKMLQDTRFSKYFDIIGSFDEHFGAYEDCATSTASDNTKDRCC